MIDYLTLAILAASRLDDAEAARNLGKVADLDDPDDIARYTDDMPTLRASMERGGYLDRKGDDSDVVTLVLRTQKEADPEHLYETISRSFFPELADVARRSRQELDAASRSRDIGQNIRDIGRLIYDRPRNVGRDNETRVAFALGALSAVAGFSNVQDAWFEAETNVVNGGDPRAEATDWNAILNSTVARTFEQAAENLGLFDAIDPSAPSKAAHAIVLAVRAQSEKKPFDTIARIESLGYPHLADLARRAHSKLPAGSFAFDCEPEDVAPPPILAVSPDTHVAPLEGSTATSFSFGGLSPEVERAAGIIGGWIDPAAEARRDVAAKARAMMAAGDLAGAVGVLVASYDANGSPTEEE